MKQHDARAGRTVAITTVALLLLLGVTVGLSTVQLGRAGLLVALVIAGMKSVVIAVIFMDLRRAPATVRLAASAGLLWLVLMLGGTLQDVLTRPGPTPTASSRTELGAERAGGNAGK